MKTGTLKELNVKPGDVVEWDAKRYEVMPNWSVNPKGHSDLWAQRVDAYGWIGNSTVVTIISRDTKTPTLEDDNPKLWRDMTPEEKGALLLHQHELGVLQRWYEGQWLTLGRWGAIYDHCAYRIKPEPKKPHEYTIDPKSHIVWVCHKDGLIHVREVIDGKPDPASVKMTTL